MSTDRFFNFTALENAFYRASQNSEMQFHLRQAREVRGEEFYCFSHKIVHKKAGENIFDKKSLLSLRRVHHKAPIVVKKSFGRGVDKLDLRASGLLSSS
jgi:hypothetical protein